MEVDTIGAAMEFYETGGCLWCFSPAVQFKGRFCSATCACAWLFFIGREVESRAVAKHFKIEWRLVGHWIQQAAFFCYYCHSKRVEGRYNSCGECHESRIAKGANYIEGDGEFPF